MHFLVLGAINCQSEAKCYGAVSGISIMWHAHIIWRNLKMLPCSRSNQSKVWKQETSVKVCDTLWRKHVNALTNVVVAYACCVRVISKSPCVSPRFQYTLLCAVCHRHFQFFMEPADERTLQKRDTSFVVGVFGEHALACHTCIWFWVGGGKMLEVSGEYTKIMCCCRYKCYSWLYTSPARVLFKGSYSRVIINRHIARKNVSWHVHPLVLTVVREWRYA